MDRDGQLHDPQVRAKVAAYSLHPFDKASPDLIGQLRELVGREGP
jgi:hypothetical protein